MSRIGKKLIDIPQGVTVTIDGHMVKVVGPKGTLDTKVHDDIKVVIEDSKVSVMPVRKLPKKSKIPKPRCKLRSREMKSEWMVKSVMIYRK